MNISHLRNKFGKKSRNLLAWFSFFCTTSLLQTLSSCNSENQENCTEYCESDVDLNVNRIVETWNIESGQPDYVVSYVDNNDDRILEVKNSSEYEVTIHPWGDKSTVASTLLTCLTEADESCYGQFTWVYKRTPSESNPDSIGRWLGCRAEIVEDRVDFIISSSNIDSDKPRKTDLFVTVYEHDFADGIDSFPQPGPSKPVISKQFECGNLEDTVSVDLDVLWIKPWQEKYYTLVLTPNVGPAPCKKSQIAKSWANRFMTEEDKIESKAVLGAYLNAEWEVVNQHVSPYIGLKRGS